MNQIRRGWWYLFNCFILLLIRRGWIESPIEIGKAFIEGLAIGLVPDGAPVEPEPTILVERDGLNRFFSLDDLPFNDDEKVLVLEWFARKLWVILEEGSGDSDYYGKIYDPLVIDLEEREAHSYVFELGDGGRHHSFETLAELEMRLEQEGIERIKEMLQGA